MRVLTSSPDINLTNKKQTKQNNNLVPNVSAATATPPLKHTPRTDVPVVMGYLIKR